MATPVGSAFRASPHIKYDDADILDEFERVSESVLALYEQVFPITHAELYQSGGLTDWASGVVGGWTAGETVNVTTNTGAGTMTIITPGIYELHVTLLAEIGFNSSATLELFGDGVAIPGTLTGAETSPQFEAVNMSITAVGTVPADRVIDLRCVSTGTFIIESATWWIRRLGTG